MATLAQEEKLLEQMLEAKRIGIVLHNQDGGFDQIFTDEPYTREAIIDHQREVVRQLYLSERTIERSLVTYPSRED